MKLKIKMIATTVENLLLKTQGASREGFSSWEIQRSIRFGETKHVDIERNGFGSLSFS